MIIRVGKGNNSTLIIVSIAPTGAFCIIGFRTSISGCIVGIADEVILIGFNFYLPTDRIILIFGAIVVAVKFGFNSTILSIFGAAIGATV